MTNARHATLLRAEPTAGNAITMTCYHCHRRTLTYNEAHHRWHCRQCNRILTTDQAVNEIASTLTEPQPSLRSNFTALMSGVFSFMIRRQD